MPIGWVAFDVCAKAPHCGQRIDADAKWGLEDTIKAGAGTGSF